MKSAAKKPKTAKLKTIRQLIKDADKVFSLATRYRFADPSGHGTCVTCGVWLPIRNLHCGHFQSRRHHATRFSEENVAPQCPACNLFRGGEQYKFGVWIDDFYGAGTARRLHREAQASHKYTREELEGIIKDSKSYIDFYSNK